MCAKLVSAAHTNRFILSKSCHIQHILYVVLVLYLKTMSLNSLKIVIEKNLQSPNVVINLGNGRVVCHVKIKAFFRTRKHTFVNEVHDWFLSVVQKSLLQRDWTFCGIQISNLSDWANEVEKESRIRIAKVETPIHDNDLIRTPIIAPQKWLTMNLKLPRTSHGWF